MYTDGVPIFFTELEPLGHEAREERWEKRCSWMVLNV